MYSVFVLLKASDSYSCTDPYVYIVESSNSEQKLIEKLEECYKEYIAEIESSYSDEDKQEDWYKDMLNQIQWDSDRKGFTDSSGYKTYTRYCIKQIDI